MDTEITVLPGGVSDNQICYMSADLLMNLQAKLGSFLKISMKDNKTVVCCGWPSSELASLSMQICDTVTVKDEQNDEREKCNKVSILATVRAKVARITVITNSLSKHKEYKCYPSSCDRLAQHCLNCLYRLCLTQSCFVNCTKMKLAKLYGIFGIVVNSVTSTSLKEGDGFIITRDTELVIDEIHSREWFEQTSRTKSKKQLGGLDREIEMLKDLIKLPLEKREKFKELGAEPPHGILLRGPPGCGKTSIVQYVSDLCTACLIVVNGPELFAAHPGETEENLRKIFERASILSEEGPCILFIDEIDSLCPKRGNASKVQESRVTGQFLILMDELGCKPNILVIGATNRPSAIDPALRRPGRFDREVIIGAPTQDQRKEILLSQTTLLPVETDLDIDLLSEMTNGYVGADLQALCHEAAYLAMAEGPVNGECRKISQEHFITAVHKVVPSLKKVSEGLVDLRPVQWSAIGGLDSVKAKIQQAVEWPIRHPEAFRRMGLPPPRGVLLYGPPGCCKTTLVRAAATACHAMFLAISGAQLYSPYVGDSEKLIAEVFQKARACAPAIILLDEIDSIVGKRSESGRSGVQDRVLSALLNEMDGIGVRLEDGAGLGDQQKILEGSCPDNSQGDGARIKVTVDNRSVLVVAATNRPDLLDEALVRPGRIDRMIHVPHPDLKARQEILKIYCDRFHLEEDTLDEIAEKTDLFTGADLENLCREAALCALTEDLAADMVKRDHLHQALQTVSPSLTPELVELYSNINMTTFKNKK